VTYRGFEKPNSEMAIGCSTVDSNNKIKKPAERKPVQKKKEKKGPTIDRKKTKVHYN